MPVGEYGNVFYCEIRYVFKAFEYEDVSLFQLSQNRSQQRALVKYRTFSFYRSNRSLFLRSLKVLQSVYYMIDFKVKYPLQVVTPIGLSDSYIC
jgi:hypothetical protein